MMYLVARISGGGGSWKLGGGMLSQVSRTHKHTTKRGRERQTDRKTDRQERYFVKSDNVKCWCKLRPITSSCIFFTTEGYVCQGEMKKGQTKSLTIKGGKYSARHLIGWQPALASYKSARRTMICLYFLRLFDSFILYFSDTRCSVGRAGQPGGQTSVSHAVMSEGNKVGEHIAFWQVLENPDLRYGFKFYILAVNGLGGKPYTLYPHF